jgi:ribonuclease BN (tRNA processing enzyme)
MKITLLGTGNPQPSLKRMGSGYIVEVGDDVIVIGEDLMQLSLEPEKPGKFR